MKKHDNLTTDIYASEAMHHAAPIDTIPQKGTTDSLEST